MNMKKTNNQFMLNKNTWDKGQEFFQAQRQKYEKSQISVYQSQYSTPFYEDIKSDRYTTKNNSENKEYFDNNIPIRVKSIDREDYSTFLRIQILTSIEKGITSVTLHLTDDKTPSFLWSFYIKQSDFINLKTQQRLRVDFSGFPQMMVSHFQLLRNDKQLHPNQQNYFHCLFDIKKGGQATLNILQSNKYKQSLHICLKFKMATDEQVKNYLCDKLNKAAQSQQQLELKVSKLQDQLSQRKLYIQTVTYKNKQLIEKYQKQRDTFSIREQQKVTQLKQEALNIKNQYIRQYQEQKRKDQQLLKSQISLLKKQNQQLQSKFQISNQKNHNLDHQIRQITHQLSSLQKQNQRNFTDLQFFKKNNQQLLNVKFQQQNKITQLSFEVEGLKRQLMDKKSIIVTNQDLKSSIQSHIKQLQQKIKDFKKMHEKAQQKCQQLESELEKSKNSHLEIKQKYEKRKQKLNQKNRIMKIQQESINKLQKQIDQLEKRQVSYKRQKQSLTMKIQDWQLRYKQLKNKLQQSQQKINQSETLIKHLNKQLTQRTVGVRGYLGSTTNSISNNLSSNRDFIGLTAQSRLKYMNTNPIVQEKTQKITPPIIKRYTGLTPKHEKEQQDRTLSPTLGRLNQQTDPQDQNLSKIKPVKFKYSGQ